MYVEHHQRMPSDESDFWDLVDEQFEEAFRLMVETPVESEDDARGEGGPEKLALRLKGDGGVLIRYRDTTSDWDQREYFLKLGRDTVPWLIDAIEKRELTPQFVQQWAKFQFCSGYIASYYLDDVDGLGQSRWATQHAKKVSVDPQRVWVARFLRRELTAGSNRKTAERAVATAVRQFIDAGGYGDAFPSAWFQLIIGNRGNLKSTYFKAQMPGERLGEWADRDTPVPPIDGPGGP